MIHFRFATLDGFGFEAAKLTVLLAVNGAGRVIGWSALSEPSTVWNHGIPVEFVFP